jgi:hypothetical protein
LPLLLHVSAKFLATLLLLVSLLPLSPLLLLVFLEMLHAYNGPVAFAVAVDHDAADALAAVGVP